jgi:hypothetical protein
MRRVIAKPMKVSAYTLCNQTTADIAKLAFVRTCEDGLDRCPLRMTMQNVRGNVRPELP